MDKRTYIRVVFDKLLRDNIVFNMIDKIVKFYCEIFSHRVNLLKFQETCPIKNKELEVTNLFQSADKTKSILG